MRGKNWRGKGVANKLVYYSEIDILVEYKTVPNRMSGRTGHVVTTARDSACSQCF
jgi:hypothetical protein